MTTLDALRVKYPHLGMALYAFEPGGVVTFECHAPNGDIFTFAGPTAEAAMASAFPEDAGPPPEPDPTTNVFD